MTTGSNTYRGLAVPLQGQSEIKQLDSSIDLFTLTGASTTGDGVLFTIQNSAGTPAVNGLRIYDYGRTRIIRTDASAHGGAFKNALDVKYDVDYAMGAVQAYAATFILDMSGGSAASGRQAVLNLQYTGNDNPTAEATSWMYFNDLSGDSAENPSFLHIGGIAADDGGCFVTCTAAEADHALRIYIENVVYYIMLSNATT